MADQNSLRNKFTNIAIEFRNEFIDRVYSGPVQSVSRRTGVESVLRSFDSKLSELLPYQVSNGEITVGNTTCMFVNESIQEYMWFQKFPESNGNMPVLTEIVEHTRPGDNFWDVGASVGIYSCFVSTVIESGTVTAIEPHPKNATRIGTNLRQNELEGSVYRLALGSDQGELEFYPSQLDVAGSYGSVHEKNYGGKPLTVEVVPGDTFRALEDVPAPDVMKIDVDGAEYEVLQGLQETLSTDNCRHIYCNICTGFNNVDNSEIYGLFNRYGYDVETIWEWPKGHYVRAEKNIH